MVDYELDELRKEFLMEAGEKLREMQSVLDGERTAASIDRLAYLAHQLKGSGGSYGYQKISADAAEIEKAAEEIALGEGGGGADARMRECLRALRNEIERSLQELGAASA